jgi:hypothetical protein
MKRAITALCLLVITVSLHAQTIPSPEHFFGFKMGADRKLALWDRLTEYFFLLEKNSTKIRVLNMGPSTEGNPFIIVMISSTENIANLEKYRTINKKIADPRGVSESVIEGFIKEGKAVICQSMGLHATEVGGPQMSPELAYDLLTRSDDEVKNILDNVIFVMVPSLNPDGLNWVVDYYNEYVGTEYEGRGLPWLYQTYAGHDNNRDGDYMNLKESQHFAKILYRDWPPQAYLDHHHMGSYGARFFVPPYCDPIRPFADPLIWREISWYGAHIAYKLEENKIQGVLNSAQFSGWGHFGWHWITLFHNIAGMLTESASANIATPIYVQPDQLSAESRQFPTYEPQISFPNPWPGGWWRLRDVVVQKKISALALLDLAARNKETVLKNAYQKAKRQTERGAEGNVKTVIIPVVQHDYLTSVKMVNTLLQSGVEIKKAKEDFVFENKIYQKGSYIVSMAQPKMGLLRNLLTETHYLENDWTYEADGTPKRPYDLATHTMYEFMGVAVDPVKVHIDGNFEILASPDVVVGQVEAGGAAYLLDGKLNNSFTAVNLLLEKGVKVSRIDNVKGFHPGDFLIAESDGSFLRTIAEETGVTFKAINVVPAGGMHELKKYRLAMFKRYYGGNMDEGWTRLVLEQHRFPYKSVFDQEFQKTDMIKNFDVIILPSDSPAMIKGVEPDKQDERYKSYPEKYRSGIGKKGVENLKRFVSDGGTLIALANSFEFVVQEFGLKVENDLAKESTKEFFCPGSTLRAKFDSFSPFAYGMPEEGLVLFNNSPVFRIGEDKNSENYETIVRYSERDLLKSGWLIGEKKLQKKAAMITVKHGKGTIVLISFRTQHRAQTDGTFKLLFNSIYYGARSGR